MKCECAVLLSGQRKCESVFIYRNELYREKLC